MSTNLIIEKKMQIMSGSVVLRPWKKSDAKVLAKIANSKTIFDNLRDGFPHPYSEKDAKAFIDFALKVVDQQLFAIEAEGKLAGSCGIVFKKDVYRKNAEIGYFIGEDYWGKGYATDVIIGLRDYIFKQYDIIRIYAEPFADNLASRRALEKAGFHLEATFEKNVIKNDIIKDSCIYSVLKS